MAQRRDPRYRDDTIQSRVIRPPDTSEEYLFMVSDKETMSFLKYKPQRHMSSLPLEPVVAPPAGTASDASMFRGTATGLPPSLGADLDWKPVLDKQLSPDY